MQVAANAFGILYGWQGATKGHPAGQPGTIAQVSVLHADGADATLVVTDGSWRVRAGPWLPGTQRDLEGDIVDYTENINGPDVPVGWESPGFDDQRVARTRASSGQRVSPRGHTWSLCGPVSSSSPSIPSR